MKKTFLLLVSVLAISIANTSFAKNNVELNGRVEIYFSPRGGAMQATVDFINRAQTRVYLAGYGFTAPKIAQALKQAKDRKVDVKIVLDRSNQTARYSAAKYLYNNHVDFKLNKKYAIMHHKFIIADNDIALGSMNFSQAGDTRNADNFNFFYETPKLTEVYVKEFHRLYQESEPYIFIEPKKK